MNRRAALLCLFAAACAGSPQSADGRTGYNAALSLAGEGKFDPAVRGLLEARGEAGADAELRYRASFALGLTYAGWGDDGAAKDPESAVEHLRQSRAWFGDALRLRPEAEDARANLELVSRRLADLEDKLAAGSKALRARLERVLADQRRIRDQLHGADAAKSAGKASGAQLAPGLEQIAIAERALVADVGTVSDVAGTERSGIEAVPQAKRTPEQSGRLAQLAALTGYLDKARRAGGDVRRESRKALVSAAAKDAEAAVAALVRAREQLLDPGSVLRGLAADQAPLNQATSILERLGSGEIKLSGDEGADAKPVEPPPHLRPERLGERQARLGDRTAELAGRLGAFAAAGASEGEKPEVAQLRAIVAKASPFVDGATKAMKAAAEALPKKELGFVAERQGEALGDLTRALEYFANLRQLIELTYADQKRAVALLDPESEGPEGKERARQLRDIAGLNRERLERMVLLLEREKKRQEAAAAQAAQAQAAQAQGQGGKGQGGKGQGAQGQGDEAQKARAAIEARFGQAETHRAAALAAVEAMAKALEGRASAAREPASKAEAELAELRRLFFTVVEHLKDLYRRQGVTRDRTAALQSMSDDERAEELGELPGLQSEHASLGGSLAEALAAQADQAAKQPAQGQQPGQADAAEKLGAAADEVRQATQRMQTAASQLGDAADASKSMSVDLEPPLGAQAAALEHLEKAIELLQPPQKKQNNKKNDKKQQKNQDQKKQQQKKQGQDQKQQPQPSDKDLSQAEVDRRLRSIREREAERRREKRRRRHGDSVNVEKDW